MKAKFPKEQKNQKYLTVLAAAALAGLLVIGCGGQNRAADRAAADAGTQSGAVQSGAAQETGLSGGEAQDAAEQTDGVQAADAGTQSGAAQSGTPDWQDMEATETIPLSYAEQFTMERYDGGYVLVTIYGRDRYLVVPEEQAVPAGLEDDIAVIRQPADHLYVAASAAMDMFRAVGALGNVRLSATDRDGWYVDEVAQAMEAGDILYAGKYNEPDYELILSEGCSLAVENLMIDHSPEVRENLEALGITVLVDYSSYESHPLGRVEWVKLYGVLTGREEEADAAFDEQVRLLQAIEQEQAQGAENGQAPDTAQSAENGQEADTAQSGQASGASEAAQAQPAKKTVAFFYLTNNGAANVRKSSDYVAKMIGLAGGQYIFADFGDEDSHSSTVSMQLEEFYAGARDADYIIYNSAIGGQTETMASLLDKWALLADFKAVQEGHVYCTTQDMYQQSMSIGYMIDDIHKMITEDDAQMRYLVKVAE